jgi:hypothetical protein
MAAIELEVKEKAKTAVVYYSRKQFYQLTGDTANFVTDCTSCLFENRGELSVFLQANETTYELLPGEAIAHTNHPDTLEVTFYEKIYFAPGAGLKRLLITREFITTEKPQRPLYN